MECKLPEELVQLQSMFIVGIEIFQESNDTLLQAFVYRLCRESNTLNIILNLYKSTVKLPICN